MYLVADNNTILRGMRKIKLTLVSHNVACPGTDTPPPRFLFRLNFVPRSNQSSNQSILSGRQSEPAIKLASCVQFCVSCCLLSLIYVVVNHNCTTTSYSILLLSQVCHACNMQQTECQYDFVCSHDGRRKAISA